MIPKGRTDFSESQCLPEKRWVGRSFSRAASGYDHVAVLQRQVGERLLEMLSRISMVPRTILDLGAGTGYCATRLTELYPETELIALDIAEGMLRVLGERPALQGKTLRICGDGESLPLRDHCVDLVFSNLAVQWCTDLSAVLAEFRRILRPGGAVLFSTFGEATLCELRRAWAEADGYSHVNSFVSRQAVLGAMGGANFEDFAVDGQRRVLSYPGVDAILRDLKCLGAHNVTANRPRHLTGKGVFRRMLEAYVSSMEEGRIEASFEILYAHGRLTKASGSGVS